MPSGMIFDIKRYAINDGPGIRTAVFFKGCPLRCWWCHNPEGQSSKPQMMFRANRCKGFKECLQACPKAAISWLDEPKTNWEACDSCGKCAEVCTAGAREMVGRTISVQELMEELEKDTVFYNQSGGGVTFTGGEPMFQLAFLSETLGACNERDIHTSVDTSGYATWKAFDAILSMVDLFLYDLKIMDEGKHKYYTSASNRLILANLLKLSQKKAHIVVRIPLIPEINDDAENMASTADFLAGLPDLEGVELMAYHEIGLAKYQALGMEYKLGNTHPPKLDHIEELETLFAEQNLPVIKHSSRRTL